MQNRKWSLGDLVMCSGINISKAEGLHMLGSA